MEKEKEMIAHHHERYDGKGYPDGLKGEEIPLGARILAVADTFDAMNSKRAYRGPLSKEDIISRLKESRGTQHSSEIVDILFELLKERPELWEKQ